MGNANSFFETKSMVCIKYKHCVEDDSLMCDSQIAMFSCSVRFYLPEHNIGFHILDDKELYVYPMTQSKDKNLWMQQEKILSKNLYKKIIDYNNTTTAMTLLSKEMLDELKRLNTFKD